MLKKSLMNLVLIVGLISTTPAQADQVYRVPNTALNRLLLKKLELDFGCMGKTKKSLEFYLDSSSRERMRQKRGLSRGLMASAELVIADVQAKNEAAIGTRDKDLGAYHTVDEAIAEIDSLAREFPSLMTVRSEVQTFEGRDIPIVELRSPKADPDAPAYLVMGSHHAREWISLEVPLFFMRKLLTDYRDGDPQSVELMDSSRIVVVPVVNPDGCHYSRTRKKMWRKNRRETDGFGVGVDNNRNYPFKWGVAGSSSWPGSDTYMGEAPGSEVENRLIMDLAEEYGFVAAVSFHSYSELVLWPWGYTNRIQARDHEVFEKYGSEMGRILGYKPMQISGLYEASGGFDDELYATHSVLTYTVELGQWFIPEESKIQGINERSHEALMYLFTQARNPFEESSRDPLYPVMGDVQAAAAAVLHGQSLPGEVFEKLLHYDKETLGAAMDGLNMEAGLREDLLKALKRTAAFPTQG